MKKQTGFVPLLVIVVLVAVACIGVYVGYKLGDGIFFPIGIGVGIVLIVFVFLWPKIESIQKAVDAIWKALKRFFG